MGGPLIDSETGRIRRGTTAEQIRGPEPQQDALSAQHAQARAMAAGAELLLPATDDAAVKEVLHLLGPAGLVPGKVYVIAYDRRHISSAVIQGTMNWLALQGIRVMALQTLGDPREAIRIVDAEDLDR